MAEPFVVEKNWSYKRYLLLKSLEADRMEQRAAAAAWRGLLAEQPAGDELPATFPFRAKLMAAGYRELTMLVGATEDELVVFAQLGPLDSRAVLAAVAAAENA